MNKYVRTQVLEHDQIGDDVFVLTVPHDGEPILPGQFFMLKAWDVGKPLMRPISVFQVDEDSVSFMYRVLGEGTYRLALLNPEDEIELLGPIGNGFPIEAQQGHIALVGGGIGIPPMYETAKALLAKGCKVDIFLGYRDEIFGLDYFEELDAHVFISTEIGNEGVRGYVTQLINTEKYQGVMACGPEAMLKSVKALCAETNTPAWLSMEQRMGCGIGACLVCNCKTIHGMKRCCKDGPVFPAEEVML